MKRLILTALVAAAAFQIPLVMADSPAGDNSESATAHPGRFSKDSLITAKVKAKLAAKHMSTLANVKVETDNQGVVWLRGKAPSRDACDLAAMLAKDTDGVTSVHNDIVIAE